MSDCLLWLHLSLESWRFIYVSVNESTNQKRFVEMVGIIQSRWILIQILICQYFSDELTFQLLTFCLYKVIYSAIYFMYWIYQNTFYNKTWWYKFSNCYNALDVNVRLTKHVVKVIGLIQIAKHDLRIDGFDKSKTTNKWFFR